MDYLSVFVLQQFTQGGSSICLNSLTIVLDTSPKALKLTVSEFSFDFSESLSVLGIKGLHISHTTFNQAIDCGGNVPSPKIATKTELSTSESGTLIHSPTNSLVVSSKTGPKPALHLHITGAGRTSPAPAQIDTTVLKPCSFLLRFDVDNTSRKLNFKMLNGIEINLAPKVCVILLKSLT